MAEAATKEAIERDIDGLPLKDHPKVDLKAILGHSPLVDEDDEGSAGNNASLQPEDFTIVENEDEDDIDEEAANCLAMRQRRSSLRTQQGGGGGAGGGGGGDPPDSPTGDRKGVRFADSLGLGLAAIRDLGDEEDPPEIPHSALTALRIRRRRDQAHGGGNKVMVLVPAFETPDPAAEDEAFLERVAARCVLLESCFVSSRELTVSGVVRVKSCAADEKTVTVRYTTDDWSTHRDVPASYVPNSNDGRTDRFVFIVHLPEGFGTDGEAEEEEGDHRPRLQLAVAFHVGGGGGGGETFWDNNDGENYVIDCVMRDREPSISGESSAKATDADCEPETAVGQ